MIRWICDHSNYEAGVMAEAFIKYLERDQQKQKHPVQAMA
jgi:hypothetical protein